MLSLGFVSNLEHLGELHRGLLAQLLDFSRSHSLCDSEVCSLHAGPFASQETESTQASGI